MADKVTIEEFIVSQDRLGSGSDPFVKVRMRYAAPSGIGQSDDATVVSVTMPRTANSSLDQYETNARRRAVFVLKAALAAFEEEVP